MSAMLDDSLSTEQLAELDGVHRAARDKRETDRIKAVLVLATGWHAGDRAEILRVDPNTVRNHFKRYRADRPEGLGRIGEGVGDTTGLLNAKQLAELDAQLQANLYRSEAAVAQ